VLSVEPPLVKPDGQAFKIMANGSDAAFILAKVVDVNGNWCPTDSHYITFSVSGAAGSYRGGSDQFVTTGKPLYYHSPMDPELAAEGGMCKVAVRATFTPGVVTVSATSPGLGAAATTSFTVYPFSDSEITYAPIRADAPLSTPKLAFTMIGATMKYHVGASAFVSVDIVDASGRIVYRVPNALQQSGWHSIPLTAGGINKSNGVYIVRCTVNGQNKFVKRVMLMR
jgi:beta-galactosidase